MYEELPARLTDEQVQALLRLSAQVDLKPGPGGSRITPLGAADEAARHLVGSDGPSTWERAMFVALCPSSQLVAHRDPPPPGPGTRIHVPLVVNPGCWVFHAGTWQQLEVGRFYRMDQTQAHGAVNWGAETRVHLIVDLNTHG